jgi:hypothetical protein
MMTPQSFRLIFVKCFATLFLDAFSTATADKPAAGPLTALALSATAEPPLPTATSVPLTNNPPPTDRPLATAIATDTDAPTIVPAGTIAPSTVAPPVAPSTPDPTSMPPHAIPNYGSPSPLIWSCQTSAPTVLLQVMKKPLNRRVVEVSASPICRQPEL